MLINTEGIVLREIKYQESDKILTIFSRKRGKIQAIAKGARKPKSQLIASTQIFSLADFILYKGKNLYTISQAEVINPFYNIREELKKLAYATYIIELIDTAITEEESNEMLFDLLVKTLSVLTTLKNDYIKLVRAFEIKYVSFIGYKPQINRCIYCNKEEFYRVKFSISNGGVLCQDCFHRDRYGINMDKETLTAMKLLLYSPLDKLQDYEIGNDVLLNIGDVLKRYIMVHIDKRDFKSLDFLKSIENQ